MTDDFILQLRNLTVGYDRQVVLKELELRVKRGSFTGLVGSNGSGKSTLLKTILGIIPPLGGRVDLRLSSPTLPALGYVPQRESLDPIFLVSCFEMVLMGACGRVKPKDCAVATAGQHKPSTGSAHELVKRKRQIVRTRCLLL